MAVLATHPIQYHVPLWRKLSQYPDLKVHVIFGSDLGVREYRDYGFNVKVRWDIPLLDGYSSAFLAKDPSLQELGFWKPAGRGIGRLLNKFDPNVILLTAYNSLFMLRGLVAARTSGIPVVMRHEASDVAVARSSVRAFARNSALWLLYRNVSHFACIGREAERHLRRLGVLPDRLISSPYCVDTEAIERQVAQWQPFRAETRRQLAVAPSDFVLIFSGKLIEKKQPLAIPEAVAMLPEAVRARLHLIVMGEGELRAKLERLARGVMGQRLHMLGFVNQSEMGKWYAAADCLILPSRAGAGETWGLVVNEAMQFGLPVIASSGVGCSSDLITDQTGIIFQSGDVPGLAAAIARLATETALERAARAKQCLNMIGARFCIQSASRGLADALRRAAWPRSPIEVDCV